MSSAECTINWWFPHTFDTTCTCMSFRKTLVESVSFCIFNTIIVHIGYIFVENGRNVLCLCFYIQFVWSWKINKYNINEVHIDSYAFYMFHILEQIYEKILLLCVLILKGHCQVMWANHWCGVFLNIQLCCWQFLKTLVCVLLNENDWYYEHPQQKHLRCWKRYGLRCM